MKRKMLLLVIPILILLLVSTIAITIVGTMGDNWSWMYSQPWDFRAFVKEAKKFYTTVPKETPESAFNVLVNGQYLKTVVAGMTGEVEHASELPEPDVFSEGTTVTIDAKASPSHLGNIILYDLQLFRYEKDGEIDETWTYNKQAQYKDPVLELKDLKQGNYAVYLSVKDNADSGGIEWHNFSQNGNFVDRSLRTLPPKMIDGKEYTMKYNGWYFTGYRFSVKSQDDLEVTSITGGTYKAGEKVRVPVVVRNNSPEKSYDTDVTFQWTYDTFVKPVSLDPGESKTLYFDITLPEYVKDRYMVLATINKSQEIKESTYDNNTKSAYVEATLDGVPPITLDCPDEVTWTEEEVRIVDDRRVVYYFDYRATLKSTMVVKDDRELKSDPVMTRLKSGYGFKVEVESNMNIEQTGGPWKRQHKKSVVIPNNVEVITDWIVVNINRIGNTTKLERVSANGDSDGGYTKFVTPVNPHSKKDARINKKQASVIYTDLDLKGNAENPFNHYFKVQVKGARVGNMTLCNELEGYVEIFGNMHEDWSVN